jgi:hypothetical protein
MAPTSTNKHKSAKKQKAAKTGNKEVMIGKKTVRQPSHHSGSHSNPATSPIGSDKDDAESVVEIDGDVVMDSVSEIDDEEELGKIPVM